MSPEELASKELAAWRKRENRHVSWECSLFLIAVFPRIPQTSVAVPIFTDYRDD